MNLKGAILLISAIFFIPMGAQADEVVELKLIHAQRINALAQKLDAANKVFDSKMSTAKKDELADLQKKVELAEGNLTEVVKATFGGESGSAVEFARKILQQKSYVDALQAFLDKDPTNESKKTGVAVAQMDLENLAKSPRSRQAELTKIADEQFQGFGFGVAIGALIDTGTRDRIESANLDPNGLVRVERDSNTRANFLLESHYFFTPDYNFPFGSGTPYLDWVAKGNWGHGPFVAVQPGSEDLIEGVGIGWMIGFKRSPLFGGSLPTGLGDSFNLGAGILVDPSEKVLGDGISANQALPAGETVIRFKETSQVGIIILFSYSFQ